MIRVSRDWTKVERPSTIRVHVDHRNASSEPHAIICGYCTFPIPGQADMSCDKLPVEDAFKQAYMLAKEKGFLSIWLDDRDQLFDFKPWKEQGLIDDLDDHS